MQTAVLLLASAGAAVAQVATTSEPSLSQIQQAAATVVPSSPTSNVKGVAFKQFYQVWLENIDYSAASGDENQKYLASKGITLSNFWAVAHPSEPNYVSAAAGDQFALDNDDFQQIPANISTIADILDSKKISWGEYQEHLPYPGFQGFNYSNQETHANDYVRKHNPLVIFDSVAQNASRLTQIKNFTNLWDDVKNDKLPQWAFITPNMTNDAHDTNITFASTWERGFIEELETHSDFWKDSLILLTFDETEHYPIGNKIFSVLVGGAIPKELVGTTDDTFYTHYSAIASVEANWGLPSLGRWDCGANIFELVANKTGYKNYKVDTSNLQLNSSFIGPLSSGEYSKYSSTWAAPLTGNQSCSAGNGILQSVKDTWGKLAPTYNYTSPVPYDTDSGKDIKIPYSLNGTTWLTGVNDTKVASTGTGNGTSGGPSPTSSTAPAATSSGAASLTGATGSFALAVSVFLPFLAAF